MKKEYSRDVLITADAETLLAVVDRQPSCREAADSGRLTMQGNEDKIRQFAKIKFGKEKKERFLKKPYANAGEGTGKKGQEQV